MSLNLREEFLTITILLMEWVTFRCSIPGYPKGKDVQYKKFQIYF